MEKEAPGNVPLLEELDEEKFRGKYVHGMEL